MPSADGYVAIVVDMDVDDAEKEMRKLDKEMLSLEKDKAVKSKLLEGVKKQAKDVAAQLEEAKKKQADIRAEALPRTNGAADKDLVAERSRKLDEQDEIIRRLEDEQKRLNAAEKKYTEEIEHTNAALEVTRELGGAAQQVVEQKRAEAKAESYKHSVEGLNEELEQLLQRQRELQSYGLGIGLGAERRAEINAELTEVNQRIEEVNNELQQLAESGEEAGEGIADGADKAANGMEKFEKRIVKLLKRVFIFSVITSALRQLRTWLSKVMKTDEQASQAMAQLKGALLTLAQPLVELIIPAFTKLVTLLTAIVGRMASLISALFGKTAKQSADAAKGLYDEQKALEGVGSAAEEAAGSLAGFDEINVIQTETATGGGGGGAAENAPDFSWADGVTNQLSEIADLIMLIGAGFALWKLSSKLPGMLGTIAEKLGLALIVIGGIVLFIHGLKDAWNNGVDLLNSIEMIGGLTVAVLALYALFGPIAAGIALIVGSVVMLVTAFHDAEKNGWNLQNTLLAVISVLGIGIGLFIATGNSIFLVVGAVAALLLGLTVMTGNGEELLEHFRTAIDGFKTFFVKIFEGDIPGAMEGLKMAFKGVLNGVLTILESGINVIIKGINWLTSRISSALSFSLPDWMGGGSFGLYLPQLGSVKLPRLAQGAVIPPNREFMAVLGDQKSGNNLEAPESLIRKIVREESGANGEDTALLRQILAAIKNGQVIMVDGTVFGRTAIKSINAVNMSAGKQMLIL